MLSEASMQIFVLVLAVFLQDSCGAANYEATCGIFKRPTSTWRSRVSSLREESTSPYILGGITSSTDDFPWMVSLRRLRPGNKVSTHFCGGSIVSENAVVTAAHCVEEASDQNPIVVLFYDTQKKMFVRKIKRIVIHPRYNTQTNDYDIAILETESKFDFGGAESFLRPICLPKEDDQIELWRVCAVAGWGKLNQEDRYASRSLLMSDVPIVDKRLCQRSYSFLNPITNRMFCAGDYEHGQKGTCQGDSGGPVMCLRPDRQRYQLMGVTSWGFSCGKAKFPSVFTDVAKLTQFIKETTGLE
ncbi:transmembrane protease serine 9 [Galendromus occidentalis]|uniref:limulus clotting factor C n=1 Tax=Galendromus occidentalis TaxID=34638 RepID=A0AAJ6QW46_9ACAR|nr:transmembrane protease serine 9 [Galendromus occidentalis]